MYIENSYNIYYVNIYNNVLKIPSRPQLNRIIGKTPLYDISCLEKKPYDNYSDFYDDTTKDLVYFLYKNDINKFGYCF